MSVSEEDFEVGENQVLLTADTVNAMVETRYRLREVKNYWVFLTTNGLNIIASILFILTLFSRKDNSPGVKRWLSFLLLLVIIASIIGIVKTDISGSDDPENETKQKAKLASFIGALTVYSLLIFSFIMGTILTIAYEFKYRPISTLISTTLRISKRAIFFVKTILVALGLGLVVLFNWLSINIINGEGVIFKTEGIEEKTNPTIGEERPSSLIADPIIGTVIEKHYSVIFDKINRYVGAIVGGLTFLFSVFVMVRQSNGNNFYMSEKFKPIKWIILFMIMVVSLATLVLNGLSAPEKKCISSEHANIPTFIMIVFVMFCSIFYFIWLLPRHSKRPNTALFQDYMNKCISKTPKGMLNLEMRTRNPDHYSELLAVTINMGYILFIILQIKIAQYS